MNNDEYTISVEEHYKYNDNRINIEENIVFCSQNICKMRI